MGWKSTLIKPFAKYIAKDIAKWSADAVGNQERIFKSLMQVVAHTSFRVTRNEDIEVEEDDAENLLFALEKELLRSKVGRPPVRLEVEEDIDEAILGMLMTELDVTDDEVFRLCDLMCGRVEADHQRKRAALRATR